MTWMTAGESARGGAPDAWQSTGRDDGAPAPFIQRDNRPTLLMAGPAETLAPLGRWADRAGLRCVGAVALEALAERLTLTVAVDLIFMDLRGQALDTGCARALSNRHALGETRLIVLTDLAGIDHAMALLDSDSTDFLCEPQPSDIVSLLVTAAIAADQTVQMLRFNDTAREGESARIEQLSEEVRRLARTIERLTLPGEPLSDGVMEPRASYRGRTAGDEKRGGDAGRARTTGPSTAAADGAPTPNEIRAFLRARRMREQFLPADLFADPAWDMILDLMAARLAGQRVSVSSLCIAAAVPPTTALRWIRQLTERGVFARIDDPADGRRVFIELTDEAAQAITAWTLAVRRNGGLLPPAGGH